MSVGVLDYGMGNLGSVRRALEECGADVRIVASPADLALVTHAILPGVGAFPDGSANLKSRGLDDALREHVAAGRPLLGICLGMQLFATLGEEIVVTTGLRLVPGAVRRMKPGAAGERIPHMGWNNVRLVKESPIFHGIPDETDFYFVHSFAVYPDDSEWIVASTDYCGGVTAAIGREHVWGVQFHPEKSSVAGRSLLKNFLRLG